jgi:hypothetical protein
MHETGSVQVRDKEVGQGQDGISRIARVRQGWQGIHHARDRQRTSMGQGCWPGTGWKKQN